jgi:Fic family protein
MLFAAPRLDPVDRDVIERILATKQSLQHTLAVPRRWNGLLRRSTMGRAIRGSNSIEGYRIARQDVVAAAQGESVEANEETGWAIEGYRRAMTHVLQLARDPHFVWSEQVVKSLHFMMLEHDLDKTPGMWREKAIYVYDEDKRRQVYEGPDFSQVADLMRDLVESLRNPEPTVPNMVGAALSHLNLTMIHPFRDGNGRMARCLQTLVLGLGGVLEPTFSSIEEYLGYHQGPYYDVLTEVGRGSWHPGNDARPFVRFCLRAHYYQANTMLRRVREGERLYDVLAEMASSRGLPERTALALWDAAQGFKVVNATYRSAADVSQQVASRDLTALAEGGLLLAEGEKRARSYRAADIIANARKNVEENGVIPNPYPDTPTAPTPSTTTGGSPQISLKLATTVPSSTAPKPPSTRSPTDPEG